MPQVAYELNERGITTKDGESWCRQSVGKVLKNELYIGQYKIADFEDADKVISDSRLDDYYEEAFSDMGVELLRA